MSLLINFTLQILSLYATYVFQAYDIVSMLTSYTNVIGLTWINQMLYKSIHMNSEIKAKFEACERQLPIC